MNRSTLSRNLILLLSVGLSPAAFAETPIPSGSDFRVSSATTVQALPRSSVDAEGNFVVVFEREAPADGSFFGVFGRRFDSAGSPIGDDFQVNTHTTDNQVYPNLDMRPNGDFVVAWQSNLQDTSDFGVFAQRFDSAANPVGGELAINTTTMGYHGNVDVAYGADGGFLVIWEHRTGGLTQDDVLGRLFDSAGNALGGEIMINTTTASDQNDPRIASRPDGTFVTTWESLGQDGADEAVVAQLLAADASPIGGEILVNTYTTDDQEDPELAVAADGSFAIVWESFGQLASSEETVARIYNADGTPRSDEIIVPTNTALKQDDPEIAATEDGGFVVAWNHESTVDMEYFEVYAQRLDSTGVKVGSVVEVNQVKDGDQLFPAITAAPDGRFIVLWTDDCGCSGVNGEARFIDIPFFTDGFESGDTTAWTIR